MSEESQQSESSLGHNYIQAEGKLFEQVQYSKIFRDSKTFVDSVGKEDHSKILEKFRKLDIEDRDRLRVFIEQNFNIPREDDPEAFVPEAVAMEEYIHKLWSHLARPAHEKVNQDSTLIPLKFPYIVPGGRFREIYYWDSYFASEGLAASGEIEIVKDMVKNISDLIRKLGFVPNGNRIYYLTRSQPPFFVCMLEILKREEGMKAIEPFIDDLEKEYKFWMNGEDELSSQNAYRRAVSVEGGILNRFYDDNDTPRPEAYVEDMELTKDIEDEMQRRKTFRCIRAGGESGWDFSSRWLEDPFDLRTIKTIDIAPADLNAVMYRIESKLAEWKNEGSEFYRKRAERRKELFNEYFWDDEEKFYFDYDWTEDRQTDIWSLAAVVPLFFEMSSQKQADAVANHLEDKFLEDGGLVTTLTHSGEQWDKPNGWAPLHWMAINGLLNYGHEELAQDIAERWIFANRKMFKESGQMKEKYNVENPRAAAEDGEYTVQNGFGWTNGIAIALINNYLYNDNSGKLNTEPLRER